MTVWSRRLVRRLVTALVALPVAAAGCTVSLVDPAGRACDEQHACAGGRVCISGVCAVPGPVDASASVDAPGNVDGGSSNTNLHPDGTFESGCGRWQPQGATESPSSTAHSGAGACRFCSTGPADFSLDDKGFAPLREMGRYRARAWLRVEPGQPHSEYGLLLRTVNRPFGPNFEEVQLEATYQTYVDGWTALEVELEVTKPAEVINVVAFGKSKTCLLVDDVSVEIVR